MLEISVHTNVAALSKKLDALAHKQLPFATAQALTALARGVQTAEKAGMSSVFDRPTPFTVNAVGVVPARKDNPQATVFVKDIAASYLEPYEFGGRTKGIGSHGAFFRPGDIELNQYGNLAKGKVKQLLSRKDVFVGKVKTKSGQTINGIWQREAGEGAKSVGVTRIDKRTGKLRVAQTRRGLNQSGHLKLLVRFEDPHPARQHMDWFKRADATVRSSFNREMGKALARAIATAR